MTVFCRTKASTKSLGSIEYKQIKGRKRERWRIKKWKKNSETNIQLVKIQPTFKNKPLEISFILTRFAFWYWIDRSWSSLFFSGHFIRRALIRVDHQANQKQNSAQELWRKQPNRKNKSHRMPIIISTWERKKLLRRLVIWNNAARAKCNPIRKLNFPAIRYFISYRLSSKTFSSFSPFANFNRILNSLNTKPWKQLNYAAAAVGACTFR